MYDNGDKGISKREGGEGGVEMHYIYLSVSFSHSTGNQVRTKTICPRSLVQFFIAHY